MATEWNILEHGKPPTIERTGDVNGHEGAVGRRAGRKRDGGGNGGVGGGGGTVVGNEHFSCLNAPE